MITKEQLEWIKSLTHEDYLRIAKEEGYDLYDVELDEEPDSLEPSPNNNKNVER